MLSYNRADSKTLLSNDVKDCCQSKQVQFYRVSKQDPALKLQIKVLTFIQQTYVLHHTAYAYYYNSCSNSLELLQDIVLLFKERFQMLSKLVQKCAVTRILQIYKHHETINVCARTLTHAIAEHFMRSIQVVPFSHEDRMTTLSHYATVKSERKKTNSNSTMLLQSHSQHGIRFVLMKMVAIFIAHGSIDLNVQCLKEIIDRKWTEKKCWEDIEKFWCTAVSYTHLTLPTKLSV